MSRESAVSHLAPKETCPSGEHRPRSGTLVLQAGVGKKGCRGCAGPQTGSCAWGQGVTAARHAVTRSPGAGLASQLGGICFSLLTTSSWEQFMGVLSFISLPDRGNLPDSSLRSLRSQSLPWGERDWDRYWEMGRGDTELCRDRGHQHTLKPYGKWAAIPAGIPGFPGRDIRAEAINTLQGSRKLESSSSPGVGCDPKHLHFPLEGLP